MAIQQVVLFAAGPAPVDLGAAHPFMVLAGSAITSTGGITITGDVGLSPGGGASITGLTSGQVTGTIYTVDAAGPAGSVQDATLLGLAQDALTAAYNDAQGRLPVPTGAFLDPNGGDIGGQNLVPGLYKFTTGASITGSDLTLTGGPDDVWIFQIGSTLTVGSSIGVVLAGGAQARNVFWQVGSSATIGTSATFRGTIMAQDSITLSTGSVVDGRALARTAQVTLDGLSGDLPNEVPVAVADAATVLEGGTVTVLTTGPGNTSVLDNDTDQNGGDTLTAVLVDDVANGALTLNADGTFSYTHDGSETSADSFTYRVYDGTEYSNTVTVSITVDPAGSIGDYVWLDANSDGSPAGENGLPGVTVDLYLDLGTVGVYEPGTDTAAGSTTTDAGGGYLFDGLTGTNYVAMVDTTTLPGGAGGAGANTHDRDGNQDSVTFATIVPTAHDGTDNVLDADFGYGPSSSLDLVKTITNGATFTIGATVNYQVVLAVPSGALITGAQLTDTLPVNLDAVTATNQVLSVTLNGVASTGVTYGAHTLGDDTTAQVLVVNLGDLQTTNGGTDPDGTVVIAYTATVQNTANNSAGQTKTNTAVATGNDGAAINKSDTVSITIVEPALAITKTVENVTSCAPSRIPPREGKLPYHAPEPDDILEYTVTLENTGTSTAYNVTIVDTLDAGLEYITNLGDTDYSLPTGDIVTAPDVLGQVVTWGNGQAPPLDIDIAAGTSITFTYRVRVRSSVVADDPLDNSATATWYSLDGGSGRDGTDYNVTSSTATVTAWDDPATGGATFTVSGAGATVAADGTTNATNITAGQLTGLDRLLLQNGAVVTIASDGVPNHANGDPDPFGTPSVNVAATASATIVTDGTGSFVIDQLILNSGATLQLAGDSIYQIGSLSMDQGSTLILPDGATLEIVGSASITGASGYGNLATIRPSTTYGGLTTVFECSASIAFGHFAGIDSGYVQFLGPTALDHGLFSEGNGTNPYVKYEYPAAVTWTNLAFRKEDGATTTIQNTQASANTYYVAVAGYLGPTDLNYIGGDSTDIEPAAGSDAVSAVRWSGATPAFGVKTSCTAPETGGILVAWSAQVELGVLKYLVQVADGDAWTTVGDVFARTEGLSGGRYEFLDRLAQPGEPRTYRLLCVDVDGKSREHAVGEATALALASAKALAAVRAAPTFPADGLATVETLTYTVEHYATDTPALLGTARKATVAAGGLYGTGGAGRIYNLGQELPDLGGMVYIRPYTDPYTDANVVWGSDDALTIVGEPGAPPPPSAQGLLGPDGYTAVVHVEKDETLALNSMLPPGPNWFYGFSSRLAPDNNPIITASVPAPAATGTATVRVAVRSTTSGAHDLGVSVNGKPVARATWSGSGFHLVQVQFDLANCPLVNGNNQIQLWTTAAGSSKRLNYVEVLTPATPVLRDGSLVVDVLPDNTGSLDVPGVVHAVDITEFGHESLLAVSRGAMGGLHAGRKLYLTDTVGTLGWSEPKDLTAVDTALTGQQYVAVTPAAWLDVLSPLIAKHQAEGLASVAVSWEDVRDTYGCGLPTPAGLVCLGQLIQPRYLLIGAGASHDPKSLQGDLPPAGIATGFVHVYEGTASTDDLYLGDFAIAVGRLPARNRTELLNMVNKIVDFYPGRRAVMMADVDDATMAFGDFSRLQADLADDLPSLLLDGNTMGGAAMRTALFAAINDGANLVTYQGHGNNALIGDEFDILNTSHVGQVPPSAWLMATCLTGVYTLETADTQVISSSLLRTPGNGAVSVLASTCYGQAGTEHLIAEAAVRRIAAGDATWGDVLLHIKRTLLPDETAAIYTLLGDPAMHTLNPAEGDREILIREPLAGGYVNGNQTPVVRFGLRGGWWRERLEISWRRDYGPWTPLSEMTIDPAVFEYTVPWDPPPEDGKGYQIMIREIDTDREGR